MKVVGGGATLRRKRNRRHYRWQYGGSGGGCMLAGDGGHVLMGDGTGGCWRRWRRRGWWEDGSGEGNLGVAGSGDWAPGATSCLEPSHSHSARTARPPPRYSPAADPNALNSPCAALALAQLLTDNEAAKTRVFWEVKNVATERFIDVYDEADMPAEKLDDKAREHMSDASEAWARVRDVLAQLNQEIIVPYTLGDQLPLADSPHDSRGSSPSQAGRSPTMARRTSASLAAGGFTLVKDFSVVEGWRRAGLTVPDPESRERQNRLAAFWDAVRERLKEMYPSGTRSVINTPLPSAPGSLSGTLPSS
ncbi:uncharacterized protein C8Q71DRAFT_846587 [Rhodofomes roseus]|uniref:Uncharacterized protein n=1 Tax=Rhodofomes roseus TaxID=34475 RepID=A0ABQ8KQX4_9APHY|nr:uncharacterized protein C8Q71DRAFT_846587 [Rhodofomes roseus]KAH9840095.1 hypothetical protein C8Q71DRAFT_846587 [Rhodofomes roseus]